MVPTETTPLLPATTADLVALGSTTEPPSGHEHPHLTIDTRAEEPVLIYCVRPLPQSPVDSVSTHAFVAGLTNTQNAVVIPPQVGITKPWAFRDSWQTLLRHDAAFVFSHFRSLAKTAWLSVATRPRAGTERYSPSRRSAFTGKLLILGSIVLTIPMAATVIAALPAYLLFRLFGAAVTSFQGADTRRSQPEDPAVANLVPGYEREAWLFVNGIATAPSGALATVSYLQHLVRRPVTAILNRTFGAWFDLWECFMQRDMHLLTGDIRRGYMELVKHVVDMDKDRIVLIGHSQGGIIVSAWIDQLLTDFDNDTLSRVEVYTFASAASHFSRSGKFIFEDNVEKRLQLPQSPTCPVGPGAAPRQSAAPSNGPFRHVEHYANDGDFVAQLGVLSHRPSAPGGPDSNTFGIFAGQIFERQNQEGHGVLDYYLGLGEGQTSILDVPGVKRCSRLASYIVTPTHDGNPLPPLPSECL